MADARRRANTNAHAADLSLGDVLEVVEVGAEQAGRAMHKAHSAVLSGYSPSLEMPAHSEAWRSSRASGSRTGCLAIGRCSSPIRSSRLQLLVSVGRVGNGRVERWWHHPRRRWCRGMSLPAKRHLRERGRQLLSVDGDISGQKSVATRSLPSAHSSIRVTRGQGRPSNATWGSGVRRSWLGSPGAKKAKDKARFRRIETTQKAKGCRHSRNA
jgi:hypothetical protein